MSYTNKFIVYEKELCKICNDIVMLFVQAFSIFESPIQALHTMIEFPVPEFCQKSDEADVSITD